MKKKLKKIIWYLIIIVILVIAVVWLADYRIEITTNKSVYYDLYKMPHNKVGLLLGTSKYLGSGQPNQYFKNRIKATVELFNARKIDYIVISGDNSKKYYNEPFDMKNELIKCGIPDSLIYLDYAGFRTYDSVIRLNKIFGQSQFTIISQEFQNKRAIYISNYLNFKAVGYNAEDIDKYYGFKTQVREKFARVKVFIDLLVDKEPKFLGPKIEIR